MSVGSVARQAPAGAIVGLTSVIYSISFGALLFSGALSPFVGFGISAALAAAIVGTLFGLHAEEKTFISGPDSNTISVMAGSLAVFGSLGLSDLLIRDLALEMLVLTSLLAAAVFYAAARLNVAGLVRYIPFPVMSGLLASTGWLMTSGALNIISETPLTFAGLGRLLDDPARPELAFGALVAAALFGLASRLPGAILIPLVTLAASAIADGFVASGVCGLPHCSPDVWMFPRIAETPWLPAWGMEWELADASLLLHRLPAMLVVVFVGLLTVLLSLASLELSFDKEFDLNSILRAHALSAGVTGVFGGLFGLISIGRTTLNKRGGGGAFSGIVAAAICGAMLLGAGPVLAYIPKAALGGLLLYLGLTMLKAWLWDQGRSAAKGDLAQIVLIVGLVANYGFVIGFLAGVVISCVVFVVAYGRIPLADLATDLALFSSSVVRPPHEVEVLRERGAKTLLFRLRGYVFFGSASAIDAVFKGKAAAEIEGVVIDFTKVTGIDKSAIGAFRRILRRYRNLPIRFYVVHGPDQEVGLRLRVLGAWAGGQIRFFDSFDHALEAAEESLIDQSGPAAAESDCFEFLESGADRAVFLSYCERRTVSRGELLCTEDERSDEIFFVESGSLDIVRSGEGNGKLRLAKLRTGAMAGEMAFYTGEARTASIVATADAAVYSLHKDGLAQLRRDHPALATSFDHMVIRKVSRSLARATKLIATLG